jgi:hypothetical protein
VSLDNTAVWLIAYQLMTLVLLIVNGGLLLWIAITLKAAPANAVNVRAILACIESVRVQITQIAREEESGADAIKTQLTNIANMIDIYILRISGIPTASKFAPRNPP